MVHPKIIGIINFTPDSFSDGGFYYNTNSAIKKISEMINEGAEIIDFGAESTNPLIAKPLTVEEEFDRVKDVLKDMIDLVHEKGKYFSMDTYKYKVAEFALNCGADFINDQSGCADINMIHLLSEAKKPFIMMHSLTLPTRREITIPQDKDPVQELLDWGKKKIDLLLSHGVLMKNVIFDPGIGFGKDHNQSWKIIKNIEAFGELGLQICMGHSRKGCMREIGDPDEATLNTSLYLSEIVDYIRVHDVRSHYAMFMHAEKSIEEACSYLNSKVFFWKTES